MRYSSCALLSASLLAGCSGQPVLPATVKVPVPVPCLSSSELPLAPALRTDAEILALPDYQSVIAVWVDRIKMRDALAERDALLIACTKKSPD